MAAGDEDRVFDAEYVRLMAAGDPDTERHFIAYFSERIRIKLRSQLRSSTLAADIRQETFLRALRGIRGNASALEKPERLGAYVNAICNHVLYEAFRTQNKYRESTATLPELIDAGASASDMLVTEERKRQVRSVLDAMPDKDRRLLVALFLEERDKDDLCAEFGVDRGYLRVLVHRAKNRFRGIIEGRLS